MSTDKPDSTDALLRFFLALAALACGAGALTVVAVLAAHTLG
jgi:hypothetical protein